MTEGNVNTRCCERGRHSDGRCGSGGCGCRSDGEDAQLRVELEKRASELREKLSDIEEALKEAV